MQLSRWIALTALTATIWAASSVGGCEVPGYTFTSGWDSPKNDIRREEGAPPGQLANSCSKTPGCAGFNTDGWLKNQITKKYWDSWVGGGLRWKAFPAGSASWQGMYKKNAGDPPAGGFACILPGYKFYQGKDSNFNDIVKQSGPPARLADLCSKDANCVAFNTNGWLKNKVVDSKDWYSWSDNSWEGMYVKDPPPAPAPSAVNTSKYEGEEDDSSSYTLHSSRYEGQGDDTSAPRQQYYQSESTQDSYMPVRRSYGDDDDDDDDKGKKKRKKQRRTGDDESENESEDDDSDDGDDSDDEGESEDADSDEEEDSDEEDSDEEEEEGEDKTDEDGYEDEDTDRRRMLLHVGYRKLGLFEGHS